MGQARSGVGNSFTFPSALHPSPLSQIFVFLFCFLLILAHRGDYFLRGKGWIFNHSDLCGFTLAEQKAHNWQEFAIKLMRMLLLSLEAQNIQNYLHQAFNSTVVMT